MKVRRLLCLAVVGLISAITARAAGDIDIPFTKFVLDNGLTLIVSEDHKAPIVGVNVWYHVGSKNEKEGKTGFAHLFEHLMFNGSENFNDDYFKAFDRVGATGMNGTTNFDRTNYFENVPNTALDTALWMESDRMGHLIGAVDQAKLDEQRGVVQNEKRQGENQPYGKAFINIFQSTYPKGHPYSWSVIGSMDDLNAASVEDVHQWFKRYYGAANAVIAIAGDVDTEEVHKKVEQYFGDIPAGPPVGRQESWVAKRTGSHRMVLQDRVPQARIYKAWNMPAWGTLDADYLGMVSNLLADGKTSRLYKRLVYDDRIATDVTSFSFDRELGGLFVIYATATPGQDLEKVEKAIDEELGKLLKEGPTARELQRVKTQYRARFVRGIERIGGFGGKSDILAMNEVYGGRPDFYKVTLQRVAEARESELKRAANDWLGDGDFTLEVRPFPKYKTIATNVDRSKVPEVASFPEVIFPRLRKTTLLNGTRVILVERHEVPVVNCRLAFDAGYAADHSAVPGTASLTLDMMDEGTTHRTALEISDELSMLGATLSSGSNLDMSIISLSALRENLDASLDIFSDVVRNPSFPEAEFARLKKEQLAKIQREKATPFQMALRVFPKLLYEEGHAYGTPFTGSGTEKSVNSLTPAKLRAFHDTWIRPNNATLIIVGDTTLREMKPKLERLFADWKSSKIPRKNLATVTQKKKSQVYIIDRPGSLQSIILAGHLIPPKANPDEIAIEAVNRVLGGGFTARINMNLREDKHWSYGARSIIPDARGQRPFLILAPVQTDRTKESMREIQKELEGITGVVPPTPEELDTAKDRSTKTLPGRWETANAVANTIAEMVRFNLPDDYWNTYSERVRALDLDHVSGTSRTLVHPDKLVWVVVGDREKIEAGIKELALGDVKLMDPDGNILEKGERMAAD